MTPRITVVATVFAAAVAAAGTTARAQCPVTIPQSVINSVQTPAVRSAAQTFRLDAGMIAENGGLSNMIRLAKAQLDADRATVAEEQRNQVYLTQNGMGADRRAADGREAIRMLEESQRLTSASLALMECHARMAASGSTAGVVSTEPRSANGWSMSPAERQLALTSATAHVRPAAPGEGDLTQALESFSRTMHEKAMANATPEMAAFLAKQDATRANNEANLAAMKAGQAHGLQEARQGSLTAQVQMVTKAVQGWQPPRRYAASSSSIGVSAVADPFAPSQSAPDPADAIQRAIATSGLEWSDARKVARVASPGSLCGGRLKLDDYPLLPDGNLLDTADRITRFLALCADASSPLPVLRENGESEVRK